MLLPELGPFLLLFSIFLFFSIFILPLFFLLDVSVTWYYHHRCFWFFSTTWSFISRNESPTWFWPCYFPRFPPESLICGVSLTHMCKYIPVDNASYLPFNTLFLPLSYIHHVMNSFLRPFCIVSTLSGRSLLQGIR